MAYHHTMLGCFGSDKWADLNGFVPEEGESWKDFCFGAENNECWETNPDAWAEWVAEAEAETALSLKQLRDWQSANWCR